MRLLIITLKDFLLCLLITTSIANIRKKGELKYPFLLFTVVLFLMGIDL